MTGNDLKKKVERFTDLTLKDNFILDGIQEAINKMGNRGHIIDTTEINATENEFNDLPDSLIRVIKVEIKDEEKYYYNYLIDGKKIRFKDSDTYNVFYQKQPFELDDLTDELEMHPMLQQPVLTYLKGFIRLSQEERQESGWQYLQMFEQESEMAYQYLVRNQKSPSKVRVRRR